MPWTKEQLAAIETEGNNIIVSAGAGSGKTAVLTERVYQKLIKGTNINELLVLTFTNAAANSMKKKIKKRIKKDPSLKEQLDLIDGSFITTFDSFALSIVKKYHTYLNISHDISITDDGADAIARRSRGTPRIANRLVKRVADFALIKYDGVITEEVANSSLDVLNIDEFGLDTTDRALLNLIIDKYDGGPVGIETIAAALSEDVRTLEDVCEPYLLQSGLLQRTPRGRKVSPEGYRHLGKKIDGYQQSLF